MLKFFKSLFFWNEKSNKTSEIIVTQKKTMSYTRDRTGFAWHDKKLSRTQWEKGYINDTTYYQTTKLDYKIFDSNVLEKMYPKCIQVSHTKNGIVFLKLVSFTTSPNLIRLGMEKYKPIFLYNKEINGEIKEIYVVPIVYECSMTHFDFKQYMNVENFKFTLSNDEKDQLNEFIDKSGKDFNFVKFNINKDFYEVNYNTLDVTKELPLTKFDFTAVEDSINVKFPEE